MRAEARALLRELVRVERDLNAGRRATFRYQAFDTPAITIAARQPVEWSMPVDRNDLDKLLDAGLARREFPSSNIDFTFVLTQDALDRADQESLFQSRNELAATGQPRHRYRRVRRAILLGVFTLCITAVVYAFLGLPSNDPIRRLLIACGVVISVAFVVHGTVMQAGDKWQLRDVGIAIAALLPLLAIGFSSGASESPRASPVPPSGNPSFAAAGQASNSPIPGITSASTTPALQPSSIPPTDTPTPSTTTAPTGPTCETPVTMNVAIDGELESTDCWSIAKGAGTYANRYNFEGLAGQRVSLSLTSEHFPTALFLFAPDGSIVDQDEPEGSYDSRIPTGSGYLVLPSSGTYVIEVISRTWYGGQYRLGIASRS